MIKLGYSHIQWQYGVKSPIYWDTEDVPHCLISGSTGGAKTVTCQLIVNQLLDLCKSKEGRIDIGNIYICDFKAGGDWDNIVPTDNYGEYIECDKVFNTFYESFVDTIHQKQYRETYLFFDEFSSYALSKDSKGFKDLMSKTSHLAFMGRSFGYHLTLISQQFNAKIIDTAIREQFGIRLHMSSNISPESAAMLFPNCEIDKSVFLPKYCGYISTPEKSLDIIQIPFLSEPAKLKRLLMKKGREYSK